MKGSSSKFTREERILIVNEYQNGNLSLSEMCKKYGLNSPSVIYNWRERLLKPSKSLRNLEKSSTFAPKTMSAKTNEVPMKKQTPQELESEVKRLRKELEWAQLQNKALNTLIDIAESQGIQIRKKSGVKQ